MIWLTSFSFAVLLFTYQHNLVESRKKSSNSSKSPWANPAKANNFMECLIQKIGSSPTFSSQEKEDMEYIVETMRAAMSGMSSSKDSSAATLQAMNMAFVSSLAELVIAEDVDDAELIAVKTEGLARALKQCFRATMGSVNWHFISEIKDLIGMFAREAADADDDDDGGDGEQFGGDSFPFNVDAETGDMRLISGYYPSFDAMNQLGGSVSGNVSSQLSQNLASTFTNSDVIKAVFNNRIFPNVARNVMGSAIQDICNNLNLDHTTSSQLKNDVMRALASVLPGDDVDAYIKVIVPAISRTLSSKGFLNQNTKNKISSQIIMAMIKGVAAAAPWNGINVANINLQNDLLKAKTLYDQQRQLTTTSSNKAYSDGLDMSSAYPGGFDSIGTYPRRDAGVDMHLGGALGSSSADLSSKLATILGSSLLQSDTFRSIFNRRISSTAARGLLNIALQQIAGDLGMDGTTSGQLRNAILQAVTTFPQGSDSSAYTQAIATAFAKFLLSTNKLNARNAKLLVSQIATGLIKSASVNAPRYGISLPGINLDSDLQKVNTIMLQLDSPQTPLSAGGVDGTDSYSDGLDATSAYPEGLNSPVAYPGGDVGVDMQLGGTFGSSGADTSSKLATTLGSSLLQSDTFRGIFNRRISSAAALGLLNIALQQIVVDLGMDGTTSGQLRNAILQAVTTFPQGSDSSAYTQAIATAFAKFLLSTNKLNARNSKLLVSQIATGLIKSVSVNAPRYGISLPGINLDSDLQKVNTIMLQLDSPQTPLSVGGDDGTDSYSDGFDAYPEGLDSTVAYPGGDVGVDMQLGGTFGSSGADMSSKLATTLGSSLLQSDTFKGIFNRRISSAAARGLLNIAMQQISVDLGMDGTTSGQLRNVILQAVTTVPQGSNSNAYIEAIAPAFARILSTNKLYARNAKLLGQKIATILGKSVSANAPRYGIILPSINLDSDFQRGNTIMVPLDTNHTPLSIGGDDGTGFYSGGLHATGAYPGGDAGVEMKLDDASGSSDTNFSSKLATILNNALLQSDTFTDVFNRGISPATARGLLNIAMPQIAADLELDATTSGQLRNAILRAVTSVPQGSASNSYTKAISTAFARMYLSTNKLSTRNAKLLGSKIATVLAKSVSVNAPKYVIRLSGINSDSDLQKVNTTMVHLDSPQILLSEGDDDGTGSYSDGLDAIGTYPGGDAGVDMQLSGTSGSSGADLSSKLATAFGNSLLQSVAFKSIFNRGIPSAVARGLLNIAMQQIAADLDLDPTTSGQLRNIILQAVTTVPQGSDSSAYTQAIATAFAKFLLSTNKLNAGNAKLLGSQIATGLIKSVSINAPRYGISLPGINLDSDLQKVNTIMIQLNSPQTPLSVEGDDGTDSYSDGFDAIGAYSGVFDSTESYSNDNQGGTNFNILSVGSDSGLALGGSGTSLSLRSILDSPNGLNSPQASSRISGLASSLVRALGPSGFNADAFVSGLKETLSQLGKSGMSSDQAKVEGLMEALVALVQILNSSQIGQVNTATVSSTNNSMARVLSSILA